MTASANFLSRLIKASCLAASIGAMPMAIAADCPTGSSLSANGLCVGAATCPYGVLYQRAQLGHAGSAAGYVCTMEAMCPTGMKVSNGVCVSTATATPSCPAGYFKDAGTGSYCHNSPKCPDGLLLDSGTAQCSGAKRSQTPAKR